MRLPMPSDKQLTGTDDEQAPAHITIDEMATDDLENLRGIITTELAHRRHDHDLEDAERAELVHGEHVEWGTLSAHSNLKAVTSWILHVTDTHEQYGVDGSWLDKQQIGSTYHMHVADLSEGDIIKVSGASHTNRKHRYYRVLAVTDTTLFYGPEYGVDEATVIEEVA